MNVHKKFFGLLIHKIKLNNLNYLIMRKVYVVLVKGSLGQIMVSVCSSLKKANRLAEIKRTSFDEVWIVTEVLI